MKDGDDAKEQIKEAKPVEDGHSEDGTDPQKTNAEQALP